MSIRPFYDYPATLVRVIDGDTVILHCTQSFDFGFHVSVDGAAEQRFRLARCNCPEHNTPEGPAATAFTTAWLATHAPTLRVLSKGQDNYGRWLGEIYDAATHENLSDALLESGHAVPYP